MKGWPVTITHYLRYSLSQDPRAWQPQAVYIMFNVVIGRQPEYNLLGLWSTDLTCLSWQQNIQIREIRTFVVEARTNWQHPQDPESLYLYVIFRVGSGTGWLWRASNSRMLGAVTVCKRIERSYSNTSENWQMISRAVAVPGICHPRREIWQLISRAEIVPGIFHLRGSYSLPLKEAMRVWRRRQ